MFKILKYSFYDLMRGRWAFLYTAFYLTLTTTLLWLSPDLSKVIISLMNVVLILVPLIATMFGIMYYYHSREFTELLLAQPVRRTSIFFGQYLGIALSLSASLLVGIGLPFVLWGVFSSDSAGEWLMVLVTGIFLSFIFAAVAYFIALNHENRIKGFGLAILAWLVFAVIYDGVFLLLLTMYNDYPLEGFAIAGTMINPIDMARVLILLQLDISALMGYTGAVFQKFLGQSFGMMLAFGALAMWVLLPALGIRWVAQRKDF